MARPTFDLFLVPLSDHTVNPELVVEKVLGYPHLLPTSDDGHFVYYDEGTCVRFSVVLSTGLLQGPGDIEDHLRHSAVPRHVDVLDDTIHAARDDDELFESDDDEDVFVDAPPVAIHIPIFCPRFFLTEAWRFIDELKSAAGLDVVMLHDNDNEAGDEDEEPQPVDRDDAFERWRDRHRVLYAALPNEGAIQIWPKEKCEYLYKFGCTRRMVLAFYEPGVVEVPLIQPARVDGKIQTLCVWNSTQATMLPQTDLVLHRRPRARRGFFGRKVDETIISGAQLWDTLGPFGEVRYDPVKLLFVPGNEQQPGHLRASLDLLEQRPADAAVRTELFGVLDFDPR